MACLEYYTCHLISPFTVLRQSAATICFCMHGTMSACCCVSALRAVDSQAVGQAAPAVVGIAHVASCWFLADQQAGVKYPKSSKRA